MKQPSARLAGLVVNGGGVAQGIVLVAFPATESVFRAGDGFGLSATRYGQLFLPQVVLAVATSLLGGAAARRFGLRQVLALGLLADVVAMALLAVSATRTGTDGASAYPVLLVATGFLGAGYGFVVPSLNSFAAVLKPRTQARAVLTLNALLGLGTALAPVVSAIFLGVGAWWGLPIVCGALALATLVGVSALQSPPPPAAAARFTPLLRARKLWLVLAVAVAYGVVETMAGTWSEPLVRSELLLSATVASAVLAAFWGAVTVGRLIFSAVEAKAGPNGVLRALPWVVAMAFGAVLVLPDRSAALTLVLFVVVGVGCSAILPLTVSLAQRSFAEFAALMSAIVIAAYEVGYGIAAFGVGPLQDAGVDLAGAFGIAALIAVALGVGTFALSRGRVRSPTAR